MSSSTYSAQAASSPYYDYGAGEGQEEVVTTTQEGGGGGGDESHFHIFRYIMIFLAIAIVIGIIVGGYYLFTSISIKGIFSTIGDWIKDIFTKGIPSFFKNLF